MRFANYTFVKLLSKRSCIYLISFYIYSKALTSLRQFTQVVVAVLLPFSPSLCALASWWFLALAIASVTGGHYAGSALDPTWFTSSWFSACMTLLIGWPGKTRE